MENIINEVNCCAKTKQRLDSIKRNLIDAEDFGVVDNLISRQVRMYLEKKAKSLNIKLQFLYASDLDGWYDDKSRTMFLSLDHAALSPISECFARELNDNKLQIIHTESAIRPESAKSDFKKMVGQILLCLLGISCVAGLIYVLFAFNGSSETKFIVGVGIMVVFSLLTVIELFTYKEYDYPVVLKKKEDSFDPILGTINNCGGIMDFDRVDINTGWGVYHNYLAFFGLPLFFNGSFLAQEVETHTWRRKSYKVLGQIKTSWREVYHFYIVRYGTLALLALIVWGFYLLGIWLNFWS